MCILSLFTPLLTCEIHIVRNRTRLIQHGKAKSFKTVGIFESELILAVIRPSP